MPIFALVRRTNEKLTLLAAKPSQNSFVLVEDEIKQSLYALNAFCPGASTLCLNLCTRFDESERSESAGVPNLYKEGTSNLIVETIVSKLVDGQTFREFALSHELRSRGIVPIAVIPRSNNVVSGLESKTQATCSPIDSRCQDIFVPHADFVLRENSVVIMIMNVETMGTNIETTQEQVQPSFATMSKHRLIENHRFSTAKNADKNDVAVIDLDVPDVPDVPKEPSSAFYVAPQTHLLSKDIRNVRVDISNEMRKVKKRVRRIRSRHSSDFGTAKRRTSIHADIVMTVTDHIVVCLTSDAPKRDMRHLIDMVRHRDGDIHEREENENTLKSRATPIVFLGDEKEPPAWFVRIKQSQYQAESLHYVCGKSTSLHALLRAGVDECRLCIVLSDSCIKDLEVRDNQVMTTTLMIRRLFSTLIKRSSDRKYPHVIMEYSRDKNVRFMPGFDDVASDIRVEFSPQFMCGGMFGAEDMM